MDVDYAAALIFEDEFGLSSETNSADSILSKHLQEEFNLAAQKSKNSTKPHTTDYMLAKNLQEQFDREEVIENPSGDLIYNKEKQNVDSTKSIVDPSWEVIDPTPDVHRLFIAFNKKFFWGKLDSVCVSWSKKMKRCAGVCSYSPNAGFCHITLSEPLLKLRPRKDLVETLLHEMIHAYLFVTHNNRDREGHGPEFHKHMNRINNEVGTNITVYHDFHDEVELYLQHKWRCNGPCQKWAPYFGFIKRSVNRAPGPNDRWWGVHSRNCGGSFIKVESPEPKSKVINGVKAKKGGKENKPTGDILKYFPTSKPTTALEKPPLGNYSNVHSISKPSSGLAVSVAIHSKTNNIHGFSSVTMCGKTCSGGSALNLNNRNTSTSTNASIKNTGITEGIKSSSVTKTEHIASKKEYDVVRNHWVNKFDSTATNSKSSSSNIGSNKRKSDNLPSTLKIPKLENKSTTQGSLNKENVVCPVCNAFFLIEELNSHLDECLSNHENSQKECVICLKNVRVSEYDHHFQECLNHNFDTKEDRELCYDDIAKKNLNSHVRVRKNRNKCPECNETIKPDDYDVHLANCLIKKLDSLNEFYSDKKGKKIKSNSIIAEERIDCLACGKNIIKSELNNHLDECLNEVFQDEKMTTKDGCVDDDRMYNCPICLKLISVMEMNDHINICLNVFDEDNETEINKRQFLSEMGR